MGNYIIAHDLGTSGNKAVLYEQNGSLKESVHYSYPTYYPHSGFVEQKAEDWWKAVCETTKELLQKAGITSKEVEAVSFSAQMMGCLPVDIHGIPLRNMIIWADTRAVKQEAWMKDQITMEKVYQITGHRISASYTAAKLLWIRENEPDIYQKSYKILQAKDYLNYRLTGNMVTDYSDASGTNLFDIMKKCWCKELLLAWDISEDLLPEPFPSTAKAGVVTAEAALETGLLPGTPVIIGGGDGSCACVGAGVVEEGSAYNVLGTSSWISKASHTPLFDKEMRTFNWVHLDPTLFTPCGTMQAAGYSYSWYRDTFFGEVVQKDSFLNEKVMKSEPGAGGVLFLPYLLGERSPRWDTKARGAFIGMNADTSAGDMTRAVMEGVGFNLRLILEALEQDAPIINIVMIGGGANGKAWTRILADIWNKPIKIPAYVSEATSLGAAVCAGVGIGMYPDFKVIHKMNQTKEMLQPDQRFRERYQQLYDIFNQSYEGLKPIYQRLQEVRDLIS
jgi:xylulokinase